MSFNPPPVSNLGAALERAALTVPHHGITLYDRRGVRAERRTYPELLESARLTAARLASAGLGPGDRVLICLPTSWELLDVIFGAMLRGILPTLVAPPSALGGASAHARKLASLVEQMGSKRLLCDDGCRRELNEFGSRDLARAALTPPELAELTPQTGSAKIILEPGDVAFMQLTSGSTGRQRAVMIRHSNVLANTLALALSVDAGFGHPEAQVVSWLPLNHDMGLVGTVMLTMVFGWNLTLFRPETFLARPHIWLERIGRLPRVNTAGPNFAYQLCVERADLSALAGCDLSSFRNAMTGAEMIRPETCAAFAEKFASVGFKAEQFQPCYGMAEATLALTEDTRHAGIRTAPNPDDPNGRHVVCCGAPVHETELRIAPPGTLEPLTDGQVGEVLAKGSSIFAGYYKDPEATQSALCDGWLRTGDLGFLKDGELYITGRLKDLLIINGHNIMPHEIEWLAEHAAAGGGAARAGAFSIQRAGEGEQAVVVVELNDVTPEGLNALPHEIRSSVGRALGLPLADVVLIKRGQIPKTTSGKVQRKELRQRYLDGKFERLG